MHRIIHKLREPRPAVALKGQKLHCCFASGSLFNAARACATYEHEAVIDQTAAHGHIVSLFTSPWFE